MSGRSVRLRSVPIQSLSELERARLQEVAFYQLQQDCELSCQIAIPKGKALPAVPWAVLRARQLLRQSRRLNAHLTLDTPEGNAASWWLAAISVHVGRHIQVAQFTCQLICLKGRSSWALEKKNVVSEQSMWLQSNQLKFQNGQLKGLEEKPCLSQHDFKITS